MVRRGYVLQGLTIFHGVLETVVAIIAGVSAGSIVLFGFGLDSAIEVLSAFIVVWRLSVQQNARLRDLADTIGTRLVGWCFLSLAAYVAYDAITALVHREIPHESLPGIILAGLSVVGMPMLARAKRRLAAEIDSNAMRADSVQSDLCGYLSGILLIGLGANAWFGWWWADAAAGLVMCPIILREGIQALRGKLCACETCSVTA